MTETVSESLPPMQAQNDANTDNTPPIKSQVKSKWRWLTRIVRLMVVLLVLGMLAAGGGAWWLLQWFNAPITQLQSQQFNVVKGDTVASVSRRIQRAGQFPVVWPMRLLVLKEPQLAKLRVGTFQLDASLSPRALFTELTSGKEIQFSVTFVEGTTFKQWQQQLKNAPQLNFSAEQISQFKQQQSKKHSYFVKGYDNSAIEGRLYPDTYSYTVGASASSILNQAANKLEQELAIAWKQRAKGLPFTTPYQALILASIIEKETGTSSERSTIASVFINRINRKMRLQTDPTVIYGVGIDYRGDITRAHLRHKNPYNTYVINGLPPTPIAMPGRAAIWAALHPETTKYLYFVAQGDGSHYFSRSLREHNKAVRRYLRSQRNK
ncbi:MAG: endolytic transglycosylase MltG [Gammaproteobacteria bacterium]|nr:endolytic transglycosylase MltG [Gammaproteobacteria bacterium]